MSQKQSDQDSKGAEIRPVGPASLEQANGGAEGAPPPPGAPPTNATDFLKKVVDAVKSWF